MDDRNEYYKNRDKKNEEFVEALFLMIVFLIGFLAGGICATYLH